MSIVNGVATVYLGDYYEFEVGTGITHSYYGSGSALRVEQGSAGAGELGSESVFYLIKDHLGSTNLTVDSSGNVVSEIRHKAWGETRYTSGVSLTDFGYTGQRQEPDLGFYYYKARWYDPALGRFMQADSIVPHSGNPQSLNRYTYVMDNPLGYIDPTGFSDVSFNPKDTGGWCEDKNGDWMCDDGSSDQFFIPYNEVSIISHLRNYDPFYGNPHYFDPAYLNDTLISYKYSFWRSAASGCYKCHVIHDSGYIPTNDELDPYPIAFWRSLDPLANNVHLFAILGAGNLAAISSSYSSPIFNDFTYEEIGVVESVSEKYGIDLGGIKIWRGEGAPLAFNASWSEAGLTIYDGAFLSKERMARALFEELVVHQAQAITSFGSEIVRVSESEAQLLGEMWWAYVSVGW